MWRRYVSSKRLDVSELYCVTTQKNEVFKIPFPLRRLCDDGETKGFNKYDILIAFLVSVTGTTCMLQTLLTQP
jgi:hypothetical protein